MGRWTDVSTLWPRIRAVTVFSIAWQWLTWLARRIRAQEHQTGCSASATTLIPTGIHSATQTALCTKVVSTVETFVSYHARTHNKASAVLKGLQKIDMLTAYVQTMNRFAYSPLCPQSLQRLA